MCLYHIFSCIWRHYFSLGQTVHLNLQCFTGGPAEPIPVSWTCSSRPRSRKRWRGNAQQKQVERNFPSTWFWGNFWGDYWPFVYEVYEVGGLPLLWLPASTYDLPVTNVCKTAFFLYLVDMVGPQVSGEEHEHSMAARSLPGTACSEAGKVSWFVWRWKAKLTMFRTD